MDNFAANLKEVNDLIDADIEHSKLLHKCCRCEKMLDDCIYDSDPFNNEIHMNDEKVWECPPCRSDSADEI